MKKLEKYCKSMLLDYEIDDSVLHISDKRYEVIDDVDILFDEEFRFTPQWILIDDEAIAVDIEEDGWVYEFGGRWYTQSKHDEEVTLTELIYIDKAQQKLPTKSFLGIRSGYELLNGIGLYKDWVHKATFLGTTTLGICEKGSLAGAMSFQMECKKHNVKPIFGMTLPIEKKDDSYEIKVYAKNFEGWLRLLFFHKTLNVDNQLAISEEELLRDTENLFFVLDPKNMDFRLRPNTSSYYQLDTVIFENTDKDKEYVDNLERFLCSDLEPISIMDAFYLEQEDWITRECLWGIGKAFDLKTKNQYFKNNDQYAKELITMFDAESKAWIEIFKRAQRNLDHVAENCVFEYDTINRRLPRYKMTAEEAKQFETNEQLFLHLIKQGFKDRKITDAAKYIERLKEEIRVLKKGNVIDYFLTLHDIIRFTKDKEILTGVGRGSAGGSLVSFLLGLIQVDPLEFDLLFERFLNDGRMGNIEKCKGFSIQTSEGILTLNEGSMLRVKRQGNESIIFIEALQVGDEILKYH